MPTVSANAVQTALLAEDVAQISGGGLEIFVAAALAAGTTEALRLALDRTIAAIDALVAAQLDAILHHDRLRRLEGSWRGLSWLVRGQDPGGAVRIKVLNLACFACTVQLQPHFQLDDVAATFRLVTDIAAPGT